MLSSTHLFGNDQLELCIIEFQDEVTAFEAVLRLHQHLDIDILIQFNALGRFRHHKQADNRLAIEQHFNLVGNLVPVAGEVAEDLAGIQADGGQDLIALPQTPARVSL